MSAAVAIGVLDQLQVCPPQAESAGHASNRILLVRLVWEDSVTYPFATCIAIPYSMTLGTLFSIRASNVIVCPD